MAYDQVAPTICTIQPCKTSPPTLVLNGNLLRAMHHPSHVLQDISDLFNCLQNGHLQPVNPPDRHDNYVERNKRERKEHLTNAQLFR